jgi:hypothetical protein
MFPRHVISAPSPIDYSLLKTTSASIYSSLMPWHIAEVRKAFLQEVKKPRLIEDRTAHIGVDLINLAQIYPKALFIGYEIDKEAYDVLTKNISTFFKDQDRFDLRHEGGEKRLPHPEADVIYFDPPWEGREYKVKKELTLYLGDCSIDEIIVDFLRLRKNLTIVLKAPLNLSKKLLERIAKVAKRAQEYPIHSGEKVSYNLWFFHS